jgi:hypothetical protein
LQNIGAPLVHPKTQLEVLKERIAALEAKSA